jgi:diadenosine tetraphosphate (Ap4A) HIT family hydrolase
MPESRLTFTELRDFLERRMKMSHVYQPLVVRYLLESGGSATLRQLAQMLLANDESQVRYYEERLRQMPIPVLVRNGIVERNRDLVRLLIEPLTFEQRSELVMAAEQRLREFVARRGLSIWDNRLLDTDPVPDSVRYTVLKESGGRCALCGATREQRPLDVDHIIPRARGGTSDYANLQVLCSKCNRSKRDQDDTDFRTPERREVDLTCPFCNVVDRPIIAENGTIFALADAHPVTRGHALVIPRRHTPDVFSMTQTERVEMDELLRVLRRRVVSDDPTVSGFNLGTNAGQAAGQTIAHAHVHLIPRRVGDAADPAGGVRGVVDGARDWRA